MANITSIEINQFRGIKQLTVSDFSNVILLLLKCSMWSKMRIC